MAPCQPGAEGPAWAPRPGCALPCNARYPPPPAPTPPVGPRSELRHDVGGETFHLGEVVVERVQDDHLGAGLDDGREALHAAVWCPAHRDRREAAPEVAVQAFEPGGRPPAGPLGVV